MDDDTGVKTVCILVWDDERFALRGSTVFDLDRCLISPKKKISNYHSFKNSLAFCIDCSDEGHIAFP